jgi:glutamate:GABA antiporter
MTKKQHLSTLVLVLFITGSIDSIRNLPSMALFGSHVLFFYAIAAIGFLLPTALVTAELSLRSPQHTGIFGWCRQHLGARSGLLAIWLQWINTMIWYPSILAFLADTLAYLIDPTLASHRGFIVTITLTVYWALTLINCRGVKTSAEFAALCAVFGMLVPMLCLIVLAGIWLYHGEPVAITLHWNTLLPHHWHDLSWPSLTATVTACLGMELVAVYTSAMKKPRQTLPKALVYSCQLIAITTVLGALAIALIIPTQKLSLIAGTLQTFTIICEQMHLAWLLPYLMIAIFIGTTGSMMNWMLSPAEGLRQASQAGLLPAFLQQNNRHGAPQRVLILQAILVSAVSSLFIWMPNLDTAYWLLTALSTELYLCMYVMLFLVALKNLPNHNLQKSLFGNKWMWALCLLGLLTCALCLIAGFIPPENIGFEHLPSYPLLFTGGLVAMVLPVVFLARIQQES